MPSGAGEETRTLSRRITNPLRRQLRHTSKYMRRRAPYTITIDYLSRTKAFSAVATLSGLEPELFCVTGRCVNHLHYRAEYMNNRCSKLSTRFEGLVSACSDLPNCFTYTFSSDLESVPCTTLRICFHLLLMYSLSSI